MNPYNPKILALFKNISVYNFCVMGCTVFLPDFQEITFFMCYSKIDTACFRTLHKYCNIMVFKCHLSVLMGQRWSLYRHPDRPPVTQNSHQHNAKMSGAGVSLLNSTESL